MWTTWTMYLMVEKNGTKYLQYAGFKTRARTKAEAVRKGSKYRRNAPMANFLMIQE